MRILLIILDSFRQDHVSHYRGQGRVFQDVPGCRTPAIDGLAAESVVFANAYPEALPTIPIRTHLFTGQRSLPFRAWQPLTREDVSLPQILRRYGFVCGLISDTYHYRAPGMNLHRGFNAYRWIRGQEYDPWASHSPRRAVEDYVNERYPPLWRSRVAQCLANSDHVREVEDTFPARVFDEGLRWIEENREHPDLCAVIDCFDPHEPWDPPPAFDAYTDPDYQGKRLILPMGGMARDWASPEEIRHIRGLYAGEAALVDHCLGRFLAGLKERDLYEDSLILLMADHGHPLADHGKFLKGGDRLYNELLRVPFMVRLPGGEGARRTGAIVQFHDALPTLLDWLGRRHDTEAMHGRSFLPVLAGDADEHRRLVITGFWEAPERCIRDRHWSLIERPGGQDELYDLEADPQERSNLIEEHPAEAQRLREAFGVYFRRQLHTSAGLSEERGIMGRYELSSGAI